MCFFNSTVAIHSKMVSLLTGIVIFGIDKEVIEVIKKAAGGKCFLQDVAN